MLWGDAGCMGGQNTFNYFGSNVPVAEKTVLKLLNWAPGKSNNRKKGDLVHFSISYIECSLL